MTRFLIGLVLGGAGSGIAYAAGATPYWVVGTGVTVAVLVWFGEFILDDLI
ncbi:hypothetical protein ACFXKC_28370 [Streptomyces sp. NPDC059340]|uniref:hypothetical protein n=1 Tax=Streptomyces sp. NPDC059340 TaxID=3346806 RepID=UPI0036A2C710